MAYAALVTVARVIQQILPHGQAYKFVCKKEQLDSLGEKVIRLKQFLEYISTKPRSSDIDELESRIRNVAYQMEDMVEYILSISLVQEDELYKGDEGDKSGIRSNLCWVSLVPSAFFSNKKRKKEKLYKCDTNVTPAAGIIQPTAAMFSSCVKEVDILLGNEFEVEVKRILEEKLVISRTNNSLVSTSLSTGPAGATDTRVEVNDSLVKILDRVTGGPCVLQVVPITGMGGIGKTTLARAVFEDPRMVSHFDVRLWVTVSQVYNVQEILRGLLLGIAENDEDLIVRLYKHLYGRRYLIVLDDMWDEEVWDKVQNAFPKDNQGSRVILTTRLLKVATYVGCSSDVHEMPFLNEDQSWDLLRRKVYGLQQCPSELEDIGKMISRNCNGLPLTIVVIAGLLKFNKTWDYWEEVAKSAKATATGNNDSLLDTLSLSYRNLPARLKACFLYLGIYREDYEIPTKELVRFWSAEGFLEPREPETDKEVAQRCLEELVERNLLLVKQKRFNGKIKTSSIHDVMRDLSLREAQRENFLLYFRKDSYGEDALRKIIIRQRRVSFYQFDDLRTSFDDCDEHVRTLRNECSMDSDDVETNFMGFKLLRVLDRVNINHPSCIHILSRLANLRYLHLNHDMYSERLKVPESISKLRNLETLIVSGEKDHVGTGYNLFLPKQIWEISRLRLLVLTLTCYLPLPAESSYSWLESLHTFSGVINFEFTSRVTTMIPNLKKLKIEYKKFSRAESKVFDLDNLVHLHHLEELSIKNHLNHHQAFLCDTNPRSYVTDFAFPVKLKKLNLEGSLFSLSEMSIIGLLPNLEVLKLRQESLNRDDVQAWEPSDGEFLKLKYLELKSLHISEWRVESTHFPRLEHLGIHFCQRLDEVSSEIGEIDTLQKLIVSHCSPGVTESVRRIHEEQQSLCNYSLQVIIDGEELPQVDDD